MGSEYEHFKGGKRVEAPKAKKEETIKERIDRETKEQQAAGSARQDTAEGRTFDVQPFDFATKPNRNVEEQDHWRKHFEISVFPKVGAANLDEFLTLCELRGVPVAEAYWHDYVWLHHHRQEWMLEYNGAENRALLHEHLHSTPQLANGGNPDPEYVRGYNDAMALRGSAYINAAEELQRRMGELSLPGSWTMQAIEDIAKILGARGHSYTQGKNEFQNFTEQAQLGDQTMRQVFRGALGQKLAREKSTFQRMEELYKEEHEVMKQPSPALEAMAAQWLDSIRDICGYALLMFGWAKREVHSE